MNDFNKVAIKNQQKAKEIIDKINIIDIWKSINADIRLVGSLRMGLLMKNKDIDFHIYSKPLDVSDSFQAMSKLSACTAIKRIECINLVNTDESCIEWHAWYLDSNNEMWQIDMIHILSGSKYDGYFENMADRILEVLTPETKNTILSLKFNTPDAEKIMGVEYYKAVIQDGIRTYSDFMHWRTLHPVNGIMEWIP